MDDLLRRRDELAARLAAAEQRITRATANRNEIRRRLDAFELVLAEINADGQRESPTISGAKETPQPKPSGRVTAADRVREAIATLDDDFGADEVLAAIRERSPGQSAQVSEEAVRKILARLARDEDFIEVSVKGKGKTPSRYRTVGADQEAPFYQPMHHGASHQ